MGLLSTPLSVGTKAVRGLLDEVIELYKTEPLAARKMAKRGGILDEIDSQIPRPKGDVSNAAALRAEGNAQRVNDADYKGQHSAPMSGDNAPLHDLSQVYPEDIYGSKGLQYYGTGDNAIDSESMDIINSLKGKPDQTVTMYRSVPSDAGDVDINAGDWVSLSESYVKQHGESALNGDYKIISKKVPASQLFTNGDSINEFGFDPSSKGLLMDKPSRMARAKEQGFDTDKKVYHGTADDFDAFDPDRAIGTQFWSTTNKAEIESGDVGAQGSGVIKEMYHRIKNPAGWEEYDKFGTDELIRKGYDGLKLPDGKGDYTYVAFDPSQYRSVDAAFNPAKASSSNLLASNPVATTSAGLMANPTGSPGLSTYMQGGDAYLTAQEIAYLTNRQEFDDFFSDDTGYVRADVLPFRTNENTGDSEFATPQMIKGLLSSLYDLGQSPRSGIYNQQSILDLI